MRRRIVNRTLRKRFARLASLSVALSIVLSGCIAGLDPAGRADPADQGGDDWPEPTSGSISGGAASIVTVSFHRRNNSDMHVEFRADFPHTPRNLSFTTFTSTRYRCDAPDDPGFTALDERYPPARDWSVVVDKGPVDVSHHQQVPMPTTVAAAYQGGGLAWYGWETAEVDDGFFAGYDGSGPLIAHDTFILGADPPPGMTWTLNWTGTNVEVESWEGRTFAYDQADFRSDDQIQAGPAGRTVDGRLDRRLGVPGDRLWLGMAADRFGGTDETQEPGTLHYEGPNGIEGTVDYFEHELYESAAGLWSFEIPETTEPIGRKPNVYGASWPWVSLCDKPGYQP